MPYGLSLFGPDEDWDYHVDWEALDPGLDLQYDIQDFVLELDLEREQEQAVTDMLRSFIDADSE